MSFSLVNSAAISAIDQVLGIGIVTTNTCQACGHVSAREGTTHAVDLIYPRKDAISFPELLCKSITRETSTKAACSNCKQFAPLNSKRSLSGGLPSVISINALVTGTDVFEVWRDKGEERFLPARLGVSPTAEGELKVDENGVVYEVKVGSSILPMLLLTPVYRGASAGL